MGLSEEREEQKRWRLLPHKSNAPWFNQLVLDEFLEPDHLLKRSLHALKSNLNYAVTRCPYYRDIASRRKLSPPKMESIEELSRWPVLKRQHLLDQEELIIARRKRDGSFKEYWKSSSGTTGRPVRVLHSEQSMFMFALFIQRLLRWERWDPMSPLATIRVPETLPRDQYGNRLGLGKTLKSPRWQHVGDYFQTGHHLSFSRHNPERELLRWMDANQPQYLITYPGTLESLVLARKGLPVKSLKGARVISAQFTEGMQRKISELTDLSIGQNYGLNEIGIVANRCAKGRYHVNHEHCHVEILNDDDSPCSPGSQGRLVVTSLQNESMPLIRYDSTDLARVADGPCECGRTSPSFLDIVGRHRSWRGTPEGTSDRFNLLHGLIETMPAKLCLNLQESQIHQHIGPSYTLRLETRGPMPNEFLNTIRNAWESKFGSLDDLEIKEGEIIPPHPSGKQQTFLSDYQAESRL